MVSQSIRDLFNITTTTATFSHFTSAGLSDYQERANCSDLMLNNLLDYDVTLQCQTPPLNSQAK